LGGLGRHLATTTESPYTATRRAGGDTTCRERSCATAQHLSGKAEKVNALRAFSLPHTVSTLCG